MFPNTMKSPSFGANNTFGTNSGTNPGLTGSNMSFGNTNPQNPQGNTGIGGGIGSGITKPFGQGTISNPIGIQATTNPVLGGLNNKPNPTIGGIGVSSTNPTGNVLTGNTGLNTGLSNNPQGTTTGINTGTTFGGINTGITGNTSGINTGFNSNTSFNKPTGLGNLTTVNTGLGLTSNTNLGNTSFTTGTSNIVNPIAPKTENKPIIGGMNFGGTNPQNTFQIGYDQNVNPRILTVPTTNIARYDKFLTLYSPTDGKNVIEHIENQFKENNILLELCEKHLDNDNSSLKDVMNQGAILAKYVKLLQSKNERIKSIVDNLKSEINFQSNILEKQKRNFNILYDHNYTNIAIPNEFFFHLLKEVEDKIYFQKQQFSDLHALTTLYLKKEYGSINTNPDMIEEVIRDMDETLQYMLAESASLNELANNIRKVFEHYMMREFNFRENELAHRLRTK